jgi:hypothetical protein
VACAFAPVAGALGYKGVSTGMREVLRIEETAPFKPKGAAPAEQIRSAHKSIIASE